MKKIPALLRVPLVLAVSAGLALPAPVAAAAEGCGPAHPVPLSEISIQLYTFAEYVGFGDDEATHARLRTVLAELAHIGYRNVEPFTFNGLTAEQFRDLLREYGLRATSRHGSTAEAGWTAELADSRTLGQRHVGSGGSAAPGLGSYEDTLATAATLDRLGARSVANGTGKVYVHNHQHEFTTKYPDPATGELVSAWELLVRNTDRRYVTFQLDIGWAYDAGEDVAALLDRLGDRIELLHVKDGVRTAAELEQRPLGHGELPLPEILAAARGKVRNYVFEQDPVFFGEVDTMLDEARVSFDYLDCGS